MHLGHLLAAQDACEQMKLDRVMFMPTAQAPLKDRFPGASAERRLELLRAAVAGDRRFEVSLIELQRGGVSAEAAVHIGDHPGDDIAGAQQAGLRAIWFNPAGKVWEAERLPDAEIRNLSDLPAVLARWNSRG